MPLHVGSQLLVGDMGMMQYISRVLKVRDEGQFALDCKLDCRPAVRDTQLAREESHFELIKVT